MNYLESVYAFLFQARVQARQPLSEKATTGNIVLACCGVMLMIAALLTLFLLIPDFGDFIENTFRRSTGQGIGRILGAGFLLLIFPLIKWTIGTQKNYQRLMNHFKSLAATEQEQMARKGARFFYFSMGSLLIPFLIGIFQA